MFRYFLAFLLINTCYRSLGSPIKPPPPNQLLSDSLATLADQCKSDVLKKYILEKIPDCTVSVPPYGKKQYQCLIFYDINMQLCSDRITVNNDPFEKVLEKQDVNDFCTLAKEWVFTNISESAENVLKKPATCGEVCGREENMNETNYYCNYYKTGLELLKIQLPSTIANIANNNAIVAPVMPEPDSSAKDEDTAPGNSNPVKLNEQIRQTVPAVAKTTQKAVDVEDTGVKSETVAQVSSKQTPSGGEGENVENIEDSDINVNKPDDTVLAPAPENAIPHKDQANKTGVVQAEKPAVVDEMAAPDLPVLANNDQKLVGVIENPKPKAIGDAEDYDSEGNEPDEENEDSVPENKPDIEPAIQPTFTRNKLVVPVAHEAEVSQKEFFPNSMPDDFSDQDADHFFPFFMTSVILMVLLYVLYHNKSKVSKVFFGLILEGRQSGRRRNSRGHAYRRLDTLEQAMTANTAAPPSKIIY